MNHLIIFDVTNCERKVGVNDTGMLTCTGFREKKEFFLYDVFTYVSFQCIIYNIVYTTSLYL